MKKEQLHINRCSYISGFSLVEIIVAVAVFLMFLTAIINLNVSADKQLKRVVNSERATQLANEGLEATRNIRDQVFSNLVDGTYGLTASSSNIWVLSGSFDTTDMFTRQITVSTISPNQKEIISTVTWNDQLALNNSITLKTYLTNWQAYVPNAGLSLKKVIVNYFSTNGIADFAPYNATLDGTTTANIFSATSTIESPANTFTFETLNLAPGNYTFSETIDPDYTQTFSGDCDITGLTVLASGDSKVCTITNEEKYATLNVIKNVINNGGTKTISDFTPFKYGVTTIVENSPTKVPPGTYTVSETVDPDYTQVFTGDCDGSGSVSLAIGNTKTCTITNTQLSWLNPNTQLSALNLPGNNDGNKIQVQETYAYVVRQSGASNFNIINISNPVSPILVSSLTLTGNLNNIFVSGNYAYVVSNDNNGELKIINISNPISPSLVGTYNASGNSDANDVFVVGTIAYLGRVNGGISGDFLTINISNPAVPTLIGSINTGATTYELVVSGNYAYLASGDNSQELKIINVTNPASPTVVGGYNAGSNTDGTRIVITGTTVFLSQSSTLYKINLLTPTTTALLGSYNAGGTINDISLWPTDLLYVFLATSNSSSELSVVNGTPNTPVLYGNFNAATLFNGVAYDINTNRAYMVNASDSSELTIIKP